MVMFPVIFSPGMVSVSAPVSVFFVEEYSLLSRVLPPTCTLTGVIGAVYSPFGVSAVV